MTQEEKRKYNKQYRQEGYGANADARYRKRHSVKIAAYMREYRKRRRDDGS